MDLETLSDAELADLAEAVKAERHRRLMLCRHCGGEMVVWHLHICDERGGANLSLDSDAARALTIGNLHA